MTLSELFQTLKTLSKSDLNSIKQILESLDFNYNGFEDKRGNQTHVRGLSHEKVCVPCAVNRNGLSIAKITNLGKVGSKDIHNAFDNRIFANSILCTDDTRAYNDFANTNNLELIKLKTGKSKSGIYHIQHINSYHSILKNWIRRFHGVATKYLNNYLIWHNFVNYAKESYAEKTSIFAEFCFTTNKKKSKQENLA